MANDEHWVRQAEHHAGTIKRALLGIDRDLERIEYELEAARDALGEITIRLEAARETKKR